MGIFILNMLKLALLGVAAARFQFFQKGQGTNLVDTEWCDLYEFEDYHQDCVDMMADMIDGVTGYRNGRVGPCEHAKLCYTCTLDYEMCAEIEDNQDMCYCEHNDDTEYCGEE